MSLIQHSAAGASAAFDYQFERAMHWLAKSPAGSVIGLETDDDVSIRGPNRTKILEQDKHSIQSDGSPFGDRSKDLWNTLRTWVEALESKEVDVNSIRFIMVTNKSLSECIAKKISSSKSDEEVDECIAALQAAAKNPPKHIAAHTERVLCDAMRKSLRDLIKNCELADAEHGTAGLQLRAETLSNLQMPEWCKSISDSIADELLGWLHRTVLLVWQDNKPAWIQRDHFINQFHAVLESRKRQKIRERAEHLIPVGEDNIGKQKASLFVKQLHLVTQDETLVDNSIRDFIRCNIEKSRLSAEGNVTDEDWVAFESTLLSRWDKIRLRVARMKKGNPDEDIGFEIFTVTTEDHREKLAGSETEQVYLTSGTYHRLADLIRVGWHPRFRDLIAKTAKAP